MSDAESQTSPQTRPARVARGIVEMLATVALALALAFGVKTWLVTPYRIPSLSMWPTLHKGQRILVDRLDTHPRIGDVVVFHPPIGAGQQRCASQSEGFGYAEPCDRARVQDAGVTYVKRVVGLPGDDLRIANGRVWRNGVEERGAYVQPCRGGAATGCTFARTITVPRGEYYMMGDNRQYSDDSRYWGPVAQRSIIGVAFFTYWPPLRIGGL